MKLIKYIFLLIGFSVFAQGTEYIPTTTVTAASQGIIYDDLGYDNGPIIRQMVLDAAAGDFDGVIFESGRTVNIDTEITFSNTDADLLTGLSFDVDGSTRVVFFTNDAIGRMFHSGLGHRMDSLTLKSIKFEYTNSNGFYGGSSDSLISFDHYASNVYLYNLEVTAPNAFVDGISGFSQMVDGIIDVTISNCYFHDIGRMGVEFYGQRPSDYTGYDISTSANIKRLYYENNVMERAGAIGELGLSVVQDVYELYVGDSDFSDNTTSLELGATNVTVERVNVTGSDNGFWFAGIYSGSGWDTPLFYQEDYTITDLYIDVTGRPHCIGGVRNISFTNLYLKFTGGSWWNTASENIDINGGYLEFTNSATYGIEMQTDVTGFDWNNVEIHKLSTADIFENTTEINLTCAEVWVLSGDTFTASDANTVTDVDVYINDVFSTEIGDTGATCDIGYDPAGVVTSNILSFPTAKGHGKYATGGRGGTVYVVSNTNDTGTGSLREALTASGPRIVVFDPSVTGFIDLASGITVSNGDLTLDGIGSQIIPRGNNIYFSASNVIVRNLSHFGVDGTLNTDKVLRVYSASLNLDDVIFDHISTGWDMDQSFSIDGVNRMTLQNSLFSNSQDSGGLLTGANTTMDSISIIRNAQIHEIARNPRLQTNTTSLEYMNNYHYSYDDPLQATQGTDFDAIGNYWESDNNTLSTTIQSTGDGTGTVYFNDNSYEGSSATIDVNFSPTASRNYPSGYSPILSSNVKSTVLADVGARVSVGLNSYDQGVVDDALNGTFTSQDNTAPFTYPTLASDLSWTDSDGDYMDDAFETEMGYIVGSDDSATIEDDGYSRIEKFLHYLNGEISLDINVTNQIDQVFFMNFFDN